MDDTVDDTVAIGTPYILWAAAAVGIAAAIVLRDQPLPAGLAASACALVGVLVWWSRRARPPSE